MIVKAKAPKLGKETEVEYEFGKDLDESIDLFGATIVHSKFVSASTVDLQAALRRCLENGQDPVAYAEGWKPGMRAPSISKDPLAVATLAISQMSDEEKMKLIEQIKAA